MPNSSWPDDHGLSITEGGGTMAEHLGFETTSPSSSIGYEMGGKKRTCAHYSDSIRFAIIEEVKSRPVLWDARTPHVVSFQQKRDLFDEIATLLTDKDCPLGGMEIERQWKNLKDTYIKIRRKELAGIHQLGTSTWRFYPMLTFIDEVDSEAGPNPLPPRRNRRRGLPSDSTVSESARQTPSSVSPYGDKANELYTLQSSPFEPVHAKRTNYGESLGFDDAYLVYLTEQLKLIANHSRTEYLKVQKQINDVISDSLIRLSENS